ncbi:ribosomal protein L21e-domain-containing protein [Xylaria acuta]|nr:ribosomal protein L21e-domain-containing protein [Xylaria acuta]
MAHGSLPALIILIPQLQGVVNLQFLKASIQGRPRSRTTQRISSYEAAVTVGHAAGLRAGTRYAFNGDFRKKGSIPLTVYMRQVPCRRFRGYRCNAAVQKGMPFKVYHGKTGVVYTVTKSAVDVVVKRKVGNRYLEKRANLRIEHVQPSRSRDDFLRRVKTNATAKKTARADGLTAEVKRRPTMPRGASTVLLAGNTPRRLFPEPTRL